MGFGGKTLVTYNNSYIGNFVTCKILRKDLTFQSKHAVCFVLISKKLRWAVWYAHHSPSQFFQNQNKADFLDKSFLNILNGYKVTSI